MPKAFFEVKSSALHANEQAITHQSRKNTSLNSRLKRFSLQYEQIFIKGKSCVACDTAPYKV